MKGISAYIREERIPFIQKGLEMDGMYGMTLPSVAGRGGQKGIRLQQKGKIFQVDMIPKVRMDILVPDNLEEKAINTSCTHAFTGKLGDGRIFIIDVEEPIQVRTYHVEA